MFSYAWDYTITGGYILINNSVLDEFKKKMKSPTKIYQPKIKLNSKSKNNSFKYILGNYIFLWNDNFKDSKTCFS